MSEKKLRLNTEWLSVCGGCHVALVDLHEKILDLVGSVDIQRCPLLTDIKDYPPADIGIVSGAIRNDNDLRAAEAMRASCDIIIAFGTCAVYGGIPGAALAHSAEEILDRAFSNNPTTRTKVIPDLHISSLRKRVATLDEVIDVDLYLPGCPPHPSFIFDAFFSLTEKRPSRALEETVCARCRRHMEKTAVDSIRANHEAPSDAKSCLMSQGYICLGSVTLDRCLAPCPNHGVLCTGCAGPTPQVLTEPNRDIRTEVAVRMARLTAISEETVIAAIERAAKDHYAYAMASRMIGEKPTFLIERWIAAVEQSP